jgi:DNA primase
VGIRGRAIDEEDLQFGKYRPIQIGKTMYNHQLGFNLYGLWEHRKAIQLTKRAVIYEGEKSCMIDDAFYGPFSVAVATCGSQLNRFQINLLVQELGVNEIILAYDKEYDEPYSQQGRMYREKLIQKCERYRGLANFYYIFDEHNLLDKKDAPCDKGQEVLETLMKRRIKIK